MIREMVPWKKHKRSELSRLHPETDVFSEFHRRINNFFDSFWEEFESPLALKDTGKDFFAAPVIDMSENDREIRITADMPGLDEKNIEVNFEGNSLVIRGEKSEEKEKKEEKYYISERKSRKYYRMIPIPEEVVDKDNIKATLKKGVLSVTLPKIPGKEASQKKIKVNIE